MTSWRIIIVCISQSSVGEEVPRSVAASEWKTKGNKLCKKKDQKNLYIAADMHTQVELKQTK